MNIAKLYSPDPLAKLITLDLGVCSKTKFNIIRRSRELRYTGLSTTQYIIVPRISRSLTNTAI